jgi:hypothetical protein
MSQPVQIWFEEGQEDGEVVRRLVCEGVVGPGAPRLDLWWRVPGIASLPTPPVLDSLLGGPLLWAAMSGQDVVVHGPVSAGGLYNLTQLIEFRQRLSPERYPRVIEVRPDSILEVARDAHELSKAIAALSGGLDSTFTAVRHGLGLAGEATIPIEAMVMIHGFDASLDRMDQFDAMRRRAEPTIKLLDVPFHVVRTNSKLGGRTWPHSAIPLTVSALSHFGHLAPIALVSSGAPYGIPRFGISHPTAVEALASGDWFRVVTDGSGFGRAEKVEMLRPYPAVLAAIKVCWEGDDPGKNCGVCEKCVVTRLNFLAAGIRDAPCFDTPLTPELIAGPSMLSLNAAREFFRTCWKEFEARNCSGPEVDLLRRRLSRVPPDIVAEWRKKIRDIIARWLPRWVKQFIKRALA